ncbi:hypothetical protein FB45DRAFT_906551 [Roridomyces roridus]|uniref:Uncharacterized protein n=1 Tax=Roridomyces roridus TaxID=1738132 RepID=A0AAD7C1A1_9AGAR|nr:hypothetical protein FB45DRAFT_906551 [Roridomyces roridus]
MLAQELIDAIVDFVPDKPSLEACTISARAFVAPALRRLFRRLELSRLDPYEPNSFERSQERLKRAETFFSSTSPHLADLVLDLEIADGNSDCLTLLQSLRKVRRLRFRGTLEFEYSGVFYLGLIDFLRQPSMQTIVLDVRTDGALALFAVALRFCRHVYVDLRTYADGNDIVPGNIEEDADEETDIQQPIANLIMAGMSARLLRPELLEHLRRLQRAEIYGPDPALFASLASACSALTTLAMHHSMFGGSNWLPSPCFPTVTLFEIFLSLDPAWTIKLSDALPHLASYFPNIVELRLHLSAPSALDPHQHPELDARLSEFLSESTVKANIINAERRLPRNLPYPDGAEVPRVGAGGSFVWGASPGSGGTRGEGCNVWRGDGWDRAVVLLMSTLGKWRWCIWRVIRVGRTVVPWTRVRVRATVGLVFFQIHCPYRLGA